MITPTNFQIQFGKLSRLHNMKIELDKDAQFSDDEFFDFCQANRELKFEKTKDGNIVVMTPTGGNTGNRNSSINGYLFMWNLQSGYGKVFDSSTGFRLPDGSMLAPDAAVIAQTRWDKLSEEDQNKFPPICPEFVIELKSKSDQITALQAKMQDWLNNGVQLGWLIDPDAEMAYIYTLGKSMKEVSGFDNTLSGDPVLPGFAFDLSVLR